ncbi:MAG: hypothetical protein ACI9IP_002104 [Arcticibacterium sp.]|jgi:uncharacterized protein (TIGR02757 family)
MSEFERLKDLLDDKYLHFNQKDFIEHDPVSIPHLFARKEDIEISGFIAAVLAWGQRKTIINKCNELFKLMDNDPYKFIMHHSDKDLKVFESFKHRTFNSTDTLYFIAALKHIYSHHGGLENAFSKGLSITDASVKNGLNRFKEIFFELEYHPERTKKHIASPKRSSACKRLNMYLRWMVRKDNKGVDFGIWDKIEAHQLICPCDVHVERVARKLGLIKSKKPNWKMAEELTENLKEFDSSDPVKYDFALFGLGVEGHL